MQILSIEAVALYANYRIHRVEAVCRRRSARQKAAIIHVALELADAPAHRKRDQSDEQRNANKPAGRRREGGGIWPAEGVRAACCALAARV